MPLAVNKQANRANGAFMMLKILTLKDFHHDKFFCC